MLKKTRVFIAVTILVLVGFVFFVCPNIRFVPKELPRNSTLVKLIVSGGLCPEGPCGSSIEIRRDGTLLVEDNEGTYVREIGDKDRLNRLITILGSVNLEGLEARKFTGTCPTAFDGQKSVYEFYTSEELVVIDSCEYVVDIEKPVYHAIWEIINIDVYGQPE